MGGEVVRAALREVLPCAAMMVVEGCIIGLTIMASTAMSKGMSPYVFVVYTNALASIILLPIPSFLIRIVACGMANQIPAMSFILAIILRSTKFAWKSSGSQARLIGTLISVAGAIWITLYKGPTVRSHSSSSSSPPRLFVFSSTHENWILGCILFAASSFTLTIWNTVQVGTTKMCPQVMKIISFYSLFGTLQSAVLALFMERDPTAWTLHLDFQLLVIVLTAIFSSLIRSSVQIWCTRLKGPYFVPMFKPFGIAYASTFGCLLFPDTFHYGSMMGAFVCGVGYYTVLWGQIKDEAIQKSDVGNKNDVPDQKVPLLQDESQV
ncbi:UNVERIFIED_CONTAM: WAT1-related protein [Sesamum radiatum]|uniref:WAT1-related protein n=1 Tax=Sesamum radiatum TaxID=300843 RepID=A0AAW2RZR5_SESRA